MLLSCKQFGQPKKCKKCFSNRNALENLRIRESNYWVKKINKIDLYLPVANAL